MSLTAEDLQGINQHFTTWFEEANQSRDPSPFELRQEERLGRLDDTLQRLSGVVQHGFSQVDKRLDQVDKRLD